MMNIYEDFINIIGHSCFDLVWYVSLDDMEKRRVPHAPKDEICNRKVCVDAITWALRRLQPVGAWLFGQQFVQANTNEEIKVRRYWSFAGGIYWWPVD